MHRLSLAIILILCLIPGAAINGAELPCKDCVIIMQTLGRTEITINGRPAKVGDAAHPGSIIRTEGKTRAKLLFLPSRGTVILQGKSTLRVGEGYLNLGKGGTFITGVPSRAGKSIVMPLDTTYVLDRGCVLKDCLPPLRIASAPRSIASASYWVYPVRGRIFVGPPHVILRPGFGRSDMRSTHDILNGNTLIAAMIGTDADQQVSHVKDVGHGSAIDLAPGSNYQDYFTTITWGYDLDHSIFKCGQEIVLDREGNILYKRILSKEQLGELFQRYPGFQERFSC